MADGKDREEMKLLGALLIICGCGGVGTMMCRRYRRLERALEALRDGMEWMVLELGERMPPLNRLCRDASAVSGGTVGAVFARLADELERQAIADASACMAAALRASADLPPLIERHFVELGKGLGCFDLPGQMAQLEAQIGRCKRDLEQLGRNRGLRLRNYQTLAICAGVALAVLFL